MEANMSMNGSMPTGPGGPMMKTMKMIQHIPQTTAWILLGVKILFFILIIIGNLLVLAVFCRSRKLRAVPYNVFIIALAIVDLLTALFTIPMDVYKNVVPNLMDPDDPIPPHYMDKSLCLVGMFSINQILTWSSTTLMVIAADRLIATVWPLKYHSIVTKGRAVTALLIFWIITSVPMYVATGHTDLVTYNPKMPCMLPYQYHPILKQTVVILWGSAQLVVCYILYIAVAIAICCGRTQVSNQKRITIMMVVVLIVFTICALPIMLMNMIQFPPTLSPIQRMTMAYIFFGLMHANSFANPIIYNVANKAFRSEMKAMCGCGTSSRSDDSEEKTAYDFKSAGHVTETNKM